jgi:hypothetical protein
MSVVSNEAEDKAKEARVIRRLPNVICRNGLVLLEGTLVMTPEEINLINAHPFTDKNADKIRKDEASEKVESVVETRSDEKTMVAVSVPLYYIESITYETALGRPSLLLKWSDNTKSFGKARKTQFIQKNEGTKEERIVNWIPLIDEARGSVITSEVSEANPTPLTQESEHLKNEILAVLNKKDWKGSFQIANELRDKYGSKYDFDLIEELCNQLVKEKLVDVDAVGGFFRKSSK